MKGLPYFKWYPADAETDESYSVMTDLELGFYHRCLNKAWINGSLPAEPVELARVMKVSQVYLSRVWPVVGRRFDVSDTDPTRLINSRQESERIKAIGKSEQATHAVNSRADRKNGRCTGVSTDVTSDVHLRALAGADSDSDSSISVNQKPTKNNKQQTPFEAELSAVARRIHQRHPAVRRCGLGEVVNCLRSITRRVPVAERLDTLNFVETQHQAWCGTEDWQKDEGQYAKGLDNWLAPTKLRWKNNPPDQILDETQLMIAESWAQMEAKNGNH